MLSQREYEILERVRRTGEVREEDVFAWNCMASCGIVKAPINGPVAPRWPDQGPRGFWAWVWWRITGLG